MANADVYIEEYAQLDPRFAGESPIPYNMVASQKIDDAASEKDSAAFNALTKYIVVTSDGPVHFAIASSPTAGTSSPFIPGNTPRIFCVEPGTKISVLDL